MRSTQCNTEDAGADPRDVQDITSAMQAFIEDRGAVRDGAPG